MIQKAYPDIPGLLVIGIKLLDPCNLDLIHVVRPSKFDLVNKSSLIANYCSGSWSLSAMRLVCKSTKRLCDGKMLNYLASKGKIKYMMALVAQGVVPTRDTCEAAALHGQLASLVYSHTVLRAPLGVSLEAAAIGDHGCIIEYAVFVGWNIGTFLWQIAAAHRSSTVLRVIVNTNQHYELYGIKKISLDLYNEVMQERTE